MIIRAIFWVGLLSVLAPHEPAIIAPGIDGASIESPSIAKDHDGAGIGGANFHEPAGNFELLADWRDKIRESIPRLRAELEGNQRSNRTSRNF